MKLVDRLAQLIEYSPADDQLSVIGSLSDESGAISSNYVSKYVNTIYDLNSYIASKIYQYDQVNQSIYQIELKLTLESSLQKDLVIPIFTPCENQDQVPFIVYQNVVLSTFSKILTIYVLRGTLVTIDLVAKDIVDGYGTIKLVDFPKANYVLGSLIVDDKEYKFSDLAPYSSTEESYAVISNPDNSLSLKVSTKLLHTIIDTSEVSISYILDEEETRQINISSLSMTVDDVELVFTSMVSDLALLTLPKTKSFDFETLITRYDYDNMLRSIPIVSRSKIYSMADILRGSVKEIFPANPDVDLYYAGKYVPYYSYFVVELEGYQTLDRLTRSFIMSYFTRGLLVKEVLLAYGDNKQYKKMINGVAYQVSNDGGYSIDPHFKPAHLGMILDDRNALGNSILTDNGVYSSPGYQYPDLAVQLVQARYVSVDISIRIATYSELTAQQLSDTYLGLLSDLKGLLDSQKFGFNSTLVKSDVSQVCWMYDTVQDVRVSDFKYSRVGQLVQEGPIVEASPFELFVLGRLNMLFDYKVVIGEDGETLNEKIEVFDSRLNITLSLKNLTQQRALVRDKHLYITLRSEDPDVVRVSDSDLSLTAVIPMKEIIRVIDKPLRSKSYLPTISDIAKVQDFTLQLQASMSFTEIGYASDGTINFLNPTTDNRNAFTDLPKSDIHSLVTDTDKYYNPGAFEPGWGKILQEHPDWLEVLEEEDD